MTEFVSTVLALLTIIANILAVLLAFDLWYYGTARRSESRVITFAESYGIEAVFIISFIAMVGSLYYSNVAGYTPCVMCWYQRIAMYPMAVLGAVALYVKKSHLFLYTLPLSLIGMFLSGYHYLLQVGVIESLSCSTVGYSISCSENFVLRYGYITIPMMAFSAFTLIALVSFSNRNRNTD
ncbi:MAG: disulfide bond formation protein B [bacterium]|nr:disulfide bond formation protein B [bacterium]